MPISHSALFSPGDVHEAKRIKQPVRVASDTNVTISAPGANIDGVTLNNGDRVLLKDQIATTANGVYTFNGAASALTRAADSVAASDFVYGFLVYVREGSANAATYWVYTTSTAVTLGSTPLVFTKVGATAGAVIDPTTTRGDLLARGVSTVGRLGLGPNGSFLGSNGTDPAWTNSASYFSPSGLTGATAASRYGGATVSGAPTTGTWVAGDWVTAQNGHIWVCTSGGTPGTWGEVGASAAAYSPSGRTGATAYSEYAGATVSGAPLTGTWAVGQWIVDQQGKQWICTGAGTPGTWTQSSSGMANPMTTNQDVIVGGTSGTPTRLGVGANGQVLAITAGVIGWVNSASGFSNPMTSIGDTIYGGVAGVAARLAIGGNGQVLTVVGGAPGWANPGGGGGSSSTNAAASAIFLSRTVR